MTRPDDHADETEALRERLAELPPRPLDDFTSERIRRRARAELVRHTGGGRWLVPLAWVWNRAEPVLVAGVVVVYLGWAFRAVLALQP